MCKRVIVIAVGLALLMAIFATCAVGTPSAEFFAVALRQHESRTLDLVYTTTVGKLTCKTRYVRTPEMLYREDTFYYLLSGRQRASRDLQQAFLQQSH